MTTEDLEALNDFAYRKDMVPCLPLLRKAVAAILMERVELKNEIEDLHMESALGNKDHTLAVKEDWSPYTFGGESCIDGIEYAEYGINFGDVSIHDITPEQMIALAKVMVDHLLLNGHRFEIRKTHQQDQREELVCLDK